MCEHYLTANLTLKAHGWVCLCLQESECGLVTTLPPFRLGFIPKFFFSRLRGADCEVNFSPSLKSNQHKNTKMSPPSRRLQTKPVITCLKTFLISYSLIFWVSFCLTCNIMGDNKLEEQQWGEKQPTRL